MAVCLQRAACTSKLSRKMSALRRQLGPKFLAERAGLTVDSASWRKVRPALRRELRRDPAFRELVDALIQLAVLGRGRHGGVHGYPIRVQGEELFVTVSRR